MQGYIKLHRSILDNTIFKCKPFSKGQAWVVLLLLTNHQEGYINVKNGELVKIERGECGYSELALADLFGWSRGKVKRFLELLESEKMIHQKTVANRTVISIINYDNYQNDTVNSTVNDTVNGHLTIHQTDINNNDKNDKNEKNVISINAKEEKKIDPYINPIVNKFKEAHKKIIGSRVYLNNAECNKLIELAAVVEDFSSTMPTVFKKLKKLKFDGIGYKPNASWLLKDNHYTEILNGAYDVENSYKTASQRKADAIDRLGG